MVHRALILIGTGFIASPSVWGISLSLALLAVIVVVKKDGWTFWLMAGLLASAALHQAASHRRPWLIAAPIVGVLLMAMIMGHWRTVAMLSLLGIAFVADSRFTKLGSEFMPELDEGSIMDMPITAPRIAIGEAVDDVMVRIACFDLCRKRHRRRQNRAGGYRDRSVAGGHGRDHRRSAPDGSVAQAKTAVPRRPSTSRRRRRGVPAQRLDRRDIAQSGRLAGRGANRW